MQTDRNRIAKALGTFVLGASMLSAVIFFYGCSWVEGSKSYSEMSPKERSIFVTSLYNDQYALYIREAKIPDLSEERKKILRQKKNLMLQIYPYINTYNDYAEQGVFVPVEIESGLMEIMDKLLGLE